MEVAGEPEDRDARAHLLQDQIRRSRIEDRPSYSTPTVLLSQHTGKPCQASRQKLDAGSLAQLSRGLMKAPAPMPLPASAAYIAKERRQR